MKIRHILQEIHSSQRMSLRRYGNYYIGICIPSTQWGRSIFAQWEILQEKASDTRLNCTGDVGGTARVDPPGWMRDNSKNGKYQLYGIT